jgi:hypothetical protein
VRIRFAPARGLSGHAIKFLLSNAIFWRSYPANSSMVGSYLNGKQEYGSKWSGIPGSHTARAAGTPAGWLEYAFVSGGRVEVQVQRISGKIHMHGVSGFYAH